MKRTKSHKNSREIIKPNATILLILINIGIFIYSLFIPEQTLSSLIFKPGQLLQLNFKPMIVSWFLHANIIHLISNMSFLFIFGRIIEKNLGALKMLLIYFGSAIISDIFASLIASQGGIGASGAIAGLISASILLNPFYITRLFIIIPIPIMLIGWLSIYLDIKGVLYPTNDNIGHFAHLGGYLAITTLLFLLNKQEKRKMKTGLIINIISLIIFTVLYFKVFS